MLYTGCPVTGEKYIRDNGVPGAISAQGLFIRVYYNVNRFRITERLLNF